MTLPQVAAAEVAQAPRLRAIARLRNLLEHPPPELRAATLVTVLDEAKKAGMGSESAELIAHAERMIENVERTAIGQARLTPPDVCGPASPIPPILLMSLPARSPSDTIRL